MGDVLMFHDKYIKTIPWWVKPILPFRKTFTSMDISRNKTVTCIGKKLFGKLYILELREEPGIKGKTFDYVIEDDLEG